MHYLLALYPAGLLALTAVTALAPRRNGPVALGQVFLPYAFLPLVLLLPWWAAPVVAVPAGLALAGLAAVLVPQWIPRRVPVPAGRRLDVATWNVLVQNDPDRVAVEARDLAADVLALQEVLSPAAERLAADPVLRERYPHRVLQPDQSMALFSRLPVLAAGASRDPAAVREGSRVLWARLDLGAGRPLAVVVAHPYPPVRRWRPWRPAGWYDARPRDAEIAFARSVADRFLAAGEPLLLVGDLNLTGREPATRVAAAGLTDAHRAAGRGPGGSWAPLPLRRRGFTLLRIDRILVGPGVVPVRSDVDRRWRGSDHCALHATVVVCERGALRPTGW